ncbi:MAG: C40 family peptidase [Muribaculaceae bacterium]|nr:C40 family peptidase [Muribaculaceae bacterium]
MKLRYLTAVATIVIFSLPSMASKPSVAAFLKQLRGKYAPDSRQEIFDVQARKDASGAYILTGTMSEDSTHRKVLQAFNTAGLKYIDSINVYPADQWAMTRISVANMRTKPGHHQEMASQVLMGMPVRVLDNSGDWWRVQSPDGYIAYVISNSLVPISAEKLAEWKANPDRLVVTGALDITAYETPETAGNPRATVTDLVMGNIVEGTKNNGEWTLITLPDGRKGYAPSKNLTPIKEFAAQEYDAEKIINTACSMMGRPYLWGGTSTKSNDCSGMVKTAYLSNGIILHRDASQQALNGELFDAESWPVCQPGDLLFFGNPDTGRVTHVAVYMNNGQYVHSSARVRVNSLDPDAEDYNPIHLLGISRVKNSIGSRGITKFGDLFISE